MLSVFASGAGLASFASDLAGASAFTVSVASFIGASGSTAVEPEAPIKEATETVKAEAPAKSEAKEASPAPEAKTESTEEKK